MRISTALNHERRLKNRLTEIYSNGRRAGSTHEDILARLTAEVWKDEGLARCPRWVHDRLSELSHERLRQLYMVVDYPLPLLRTPPEKWAYVIWKLRVDGEIVDSDEISRRRKAGDEDIWERVEGAHVWNHNGKLFGSWGQTRSLPHKVSK